MGDRYLKVFFTILLIIFTSMSGCFGSDDRTSDDDLDKDDDDNVNVVIPETTKQLGEDELSSLASISEDASEIVFEGTNVPDMNEGDVLSIGISENTPHGLLRKVTGITSGGDRTTITTEQASIEDAVEEGRLEYNTSVTQPEKLTYSVEGVSLQEEPTRSIDDGLFISNVQLYSSPEGSIIINGFIDMDFDLVFVLELEDFSITECSFGAVTTFTGQLDLTSTGDLDIDTKLEVARIEFTPFVIPMGAVEVILVPVLSIVIGSHGTISTGVTMNSEQNTVLDVKVTHPAWDPVKDFTSNFEYSTPVLANGSSITCFAGPEMKLLLWGIAGPSITAHAYILGESDDEGTWWLYGGLMLGMGFNIEVLGTTIKEWNKGDIIDFSRLIATSMDDLAGEWTVEKIDLSMQLSRPILKKADDGSLVLVYTSIDPETGYYPINMAVMKDGIWSFEELVFSNEYDIMDIAISPSGDVYLAYYDGGFDPYIEIAHWDGIRAMTYRYMDPDMKGHFVSELKMILDDEGRPNVYYVLTENHGSGFFEFNPTLLKKLVLEDYRFTNTTLIDDERISITGLDLERADDGTLHMCYMDTRIDIYHQYLVHSVLQDGSWIDSQVYHGDGIFNNPSYTDLAIDSDGSPSILFDDNNGTVFYYSHDGSRWIKGESPGIYDPELGIFSLHLLHGTRPVTSYIGSSGSQERTVHFSIQRSEGWDGVEIMKWKGWRFPGGSDIEEAGTRTYIVYSDGLYIRAASKEM